MAWKHRRVDINYFPGIFMLSLEIHWNQNWYVCINNFFFLFLFRVFFFSLQSPVPVVTMEALIGETVYLPCNVSTHDINDDVVLVLWYRADKGTPVYRYEMDRILYFSIVIYSPVISTARLYSTVLFFFGSLSRVVIRFHFLIAIH